MCQKDNKFRSPRGELDYGISSLMVKVERENTGIDVQESPNESLAK
jgi:hypothetical protein